MRKLFLILLPLLLISLFPVNAAEANQTYVTDNSISKLDKFAQTCIDKGMSFEDIRSTLIRSGWRVDLVDLVLDDFK